MLILMLATLFNAFFFVLVNAFFWHHNLKKKTPRADQRVLSSASIAVLCALDEAESLVAFQL